MKIYRVIDDGECILVTTSELKALREFHKRMKDHPETSDWGFIDAEYLV